MIERLLVLMIWYCMLMGLIGLVVADYGMITLYGNTNMLVWWLLAFLLVLPAHIFVLFASYVIIKGFMNNGTKNKKRNYI